MMWMARCVMIYSDEVLEKGMGVMGFLEEIQYELVQQQPKLEFQGSRTDNAGLYVSIGTWGINGMGYDNIPHWPLSIPDQWSNIESEAPGGTKIYCASPVLNATLNWPTNPPTTQYERNEAAWAGYFFKVNVRGTSWVVWHIFHCQQRHHQYALPVDGSS